jgi:two-component sensor histidine kinase
MQQRKKSSPLAWHAKRYNFLEMAETKEANELCALNEKFREMKHSINNSLAVIMALSELAQRNPQHYEKLTKAVLARCPDIVAQLQEYSRELNTRLASTTPVSRA